MMSTCRWYITVLPKWISYSFENDKMTVIWKSLVDLSLIYLRIYPHHFNMIGDHPFGMIGWPSFRYDWSAVSGWLALLPHFGSRGGDFPLVISEWESFFLSFQKESFRQKSRCFTPDFNPPLFAWFFERKSAFRNGKFISKKLPKSYHSGRKIIS